MFESSSPTPYEYTWKVGGHPQTKRMSERKIRINRKGRWGYAGGGRVCEEEAGRENKKGREGGRREGAREASLKRRNKNN